MKLSILRQWISIPNRCERNGLIQNCAPLFFPLAGFIDSWKIKPKDMETHKDNTTQKFLRFWNYIPKTRQRKNHQNNLSRQENWTNFRQKPQLAFFKQKKLTVLHMHSGTMLLKSREKHNRRRNLQNSSH